MISSENCCQVFPISSKFTYVLVAWVGVNSRWGSIFSISLFDWGSIRIFVGWGSNQDWGSIRADTVFKFKLTLQPIVMFLSIDFKINEMSSILGL